IRQSLSRAYILTDTATTPIYPLSLHDALPICFSNARQTLLSRVHSASEDLPINKHDAFTVSLWTKVNGTGQNDLRVFSEGNTGISDPLFNLGTHNVNGGLDVFIRQSGWTTVNHVTTTAQPF